MYFGGLQKLSLVDFPGRLAATVFTAGCNLRCPFCHNALLVTRLEQTPPMDQEEILSFLRGRRGRSLCRRAFFRQGCGCYPGRFCYGRNALVGNAFKRRRLCTGCKLAEKKAG